LINVLVHPNDFLGQIPGHISWGNKCQTHKHRAVPNSEQEPIVENQTFVFLRINGLEGTATRCTFEQSFIVIFGHSV